MVRASYLPSFMRTEGQEQEPTRADRINYAGLSAAVRNVAGGLNLGAEIGYRRFVDGLQAYALLRAKQCGNLLVAWLKERGADHPEIVNFWAERLADMAARHSVAFEAVTCPPPGGSGEEINLAAHLAFVVAHKLGVPFRPLFSNPDPRGHKVTIHEKLRAPGGAFVYQREPDGSNVLVVDDDMYTRQTALRCVRAAAGDNLFFVVLYS